MHLYIYIGDTDRKPATAGNNEYQDNNIEKVIYEKQIIYFVWSVCVTYTSMYSII